MEEEEKQGYFDGLTAALTLGRDLLAAGESGLDVVEKVIRVLEDDPLFNAGKGAVFTHQGRNELDAAIMDGRDLSCGAISGVSTVKNPISLARRVMTDSRHVFFVGPGAEQFADEAGVERVDSEYFFVQRRWDQLQEALAEERGAAASEGDELGTVGVAVLDRHGDLAAGTSTGGMTNKRFGRVGDVPVIGAGTYANNKTAAISCTGFGEQFIRNNVSHDVSALMEYKGLTLQEAAEAVIHGKLNPGDGGLIAVDHTGAIALVFNSEGMFRGAADAGGRFEVAIWE
jgi:beta-aspartyl-peptidase (threonine type)